MELINVKMYNRQSQTISTDLNLTFCLISGYMTDEGKTKCTLVFKSESLVQLTKIRIQVCIYMLIGVEEEL